MSAGSSANIHNTERSQADAELAVKLIPVKLQGGAFALTWWLREIFVYQSIVGYDCWAQYNTTSVSETTQNKICLDLSTARCLRRYPLPVRECPGIFTAKHVPGHRALRQDSDPRRDTPADTGQDSRD